MSTTFRTATEARLVYVVVSTPACHAADRGSIPRPGMFRCKNLALNIRDCLSLCLSENTLKAVSPFYLVSIPGEVKDPTSLHWKCRTDVSRRYCRALRRVVDKLPK